MKKQFLVLEEDERELEIREVLESKLKLFVVKNDSDDFTQEERELPVNDLYVVADGERVVAEFEREFISDNDFGMSVKEIFLKDFKDEEVRKVGRRLSLIEA